MMKGAKKIGILLLGSLLGGVLALYVAERFGFIQAEPTERNSHIPQIDFSKAEVEVVEFDQVFDELKQEKEAQKETHWFDDKLEQAEREAKESIESLEKQGDDAKSEFDKYR